MNYPIRIWTLFFCSLGFGLVLVINLYNIQITNGSSYALAAADQYIRPNYHQYARGDILMQLPDGERMPLATIQSGFLASVNPRDIADPEELYRKLSSIIELDYEQFISRVSRDTTYVEIAHNIKREEVDKWTSISSEITLHPQGWRYYPGDQMASHLTGFVGFQDNVRTGQYGLERFYEDILKRESRQTRINFFAEAFSNLTASASGYEKEGTLITTIDPVVQSQLEKKLSDLAEDTQSRQVGGIIMDPRTGAIKAMASWPNYNPNTYGSEDNRLFSNPNIESVFEMGSIIKPLTIAAGIDARAITPETEYYDSGRIEVDGYTISNFDGRGRGYINMQRVLNDSVNTGVVHIVDTMGHGKFADYMNRFGLADKTGIDLPNEAANMLRSFESPRRVEYATASFGQGIALSPIGTIRALSALGNGGLIVRPHLVESIEYENGRTEKTDSSAKTERVISQESSETITRMLVNTVDEALLHGSVKRDHHSIAAKTGTAQIPRTDRAGYRDDAFLHSFFGYFPAFDPEFIILLYILEPRGYQYASQSLTMPFMDLTDFIINHYNIPPDR